MTTKLLGIDPGRSKTGLALTDEQGKILALHIASTSEMRQELADFVGNASVKAIIMGNGTNSKVIMNDVAAVFPQLPLHLIGEAHSTEEARSLYWQENPPTGWRRLVPLGMLVPDESLDAYAAVVQIRRWLKNQGRLWNENIQK